MSRNRFDDEFTVHEFTVQRGLRLIVYGEVIEILVILIFYPPSYSLIDAINEQIERKFYQSKLHLFRERKEENE